MSERPSASVRLAQMFADDQRDHGAVPAVGTPAYAALRERDRIRRAEAAVAMAELNESIGPSPADLYHAAWLFNHGDAPGEARQAHDWSREAAECGHAPARWLTAAAYDRWCMYEGRPQKYGTQFVPDGVRYRLWDFDPATTDADREVWGVPPLAELQLRGREMSRTSPQPPLDQAPPWLKAALERWRRESS